MSALRHFTVTAPDGVALDAVAQGPDLAEPLILLHGFSDSRRSFEPFMAALPANIHAVAVSQRGHGASSKPVGSNAYRAQRFAGDVIAVLGALGHTQGSLLGHSMGAWVALNTALRHPRRITGLTLIGAFARFAGNPGVADLVSDIAALTDPVDPAFVWGFQEAASSSDLPTDFFEMVVAESLRLPAHVWKNVSEAFLADDVPLGLSAIKVPVQLVWGGLDPFVARADQDALLKAIPDSGLYVCKSRGHSPHWDAPDEIARLVAGLTNNRQHAA